MPTALETVRRAMRLVGALGAGETPTADEQTDGLASLNAMLDAWWIQKLAVYRNVETSIAWTGSSMTIGATGDVVAERPARIESATQRLNGIDYPVRVLTDKQWRDIPDKTSSTGTLITDLWMDPTYPNATLYAYPLASGTLLIRALARLQSFETATEAMSLPPGYEDAITYNLAVRLAPEYQRAVPQDVARTARVSLRQVKRMNAETPIMQTGTPWDASGYWDWRTGTNG